MAYYFSQALKASDHNTAGGFDQYYRSPTQYQGGALRIAGGSWAITSASAGDHFLACRLLATDRIWDLVIFGAGDEDASFTTDVTIYTADIYGEPEEVSTTYAYLVNDTARAISAFEYAGHSLSVTRTGKTLREIIYAATPDNTYKSNQQFYVGYRIGADIDVDPTNFGLYVKYTSVSD